MKNTADTYDEFIEKTILNPIIFKTLNLDPDFMNVKYGPVNAKEIKAALWDAFKAGRSYQFDIRHNTK